MPIRIPVDAHAITLAVTDYETLTRQIQVGRRTQVMRERVQRVRDVPPRHDGPSVQRAFAAANAILAQIDIQFDCRSFTPGRADMPSNSDTVDEQGFFFLAGQFPSRNGVSLLLVYRFTSADLGGQSLEDRSVCIVPNLGDSLAGKVLAHEFGHLLGLDHVQQNVEDHYNLMYPGLTADTRLTPEQGNLARQSPLAQQFAVRTAPPRAAASQAQPSTKPGPLTK